LWWTRSNSRAGSTSFKVGCSVVLSKVKCLFTACTLTVGCCVGAAHVFKAVVRPSTVFVRILAARCGFCIFGVNIEMPALPVADVDASTIR